MSLFSKLLFIFIAVGLFAAAPPAHAQDTSLDVEERRAELEEELADLTKEIEHQRQILQEKQRETASLERDVAILDARIQSAELSIRARQIEINQLASEIREKEGTIGQLSEKADRERASLAELMRKTHELDSFSLVEIVLSNKNLSEFMRDIDSFAAIKGALSDSFKRIARVKTQTREEKDVLEKKQQQQVELRRIQRLEKQRIENAQAEKRELLEVTRGQEERYKQIVAEKEQTAAEIRSELFALRGSESIPFEEALELANRASEGTGVRSAFLLGVIAQESNLGENVGQCLLTNEPRRGDGVGVNTGRHFSQVMKGSRDVDIFMNITQRLGLSPYDMVVSCPPGYGYGGAMGPAQFIPSTWVLYEDKVASVVGAHVANPWNPEHAFTASALLLRDNGAARGGYNAERLAALRYFAGWRNATNPAYAFYGDQVMELAAKYQRQIDILESS